MSVKKFSIPLIVLLFIVTPSCNWIEEIEKEEVPKAVINSFEKDFQTQDKVSWEKTGKLFKAGFKKDVKLEYDIWYNAEGEIVEMEKEIYESEIPTKIKTSIDKFYKNDEFDEAEVVFKNGEIFYRVEFVQNGKDIEVAFDSLGNQLSITPEL